jgi:hypothetical protein
MNLFRKAALGFALLSSAVWAFGQDYHSWQYQDRDDLGVYKQGYEQGRADAQSGRRFHPDADRYREGDDRRAYQQGYQAGYNSARNRGDHDGDRDRDHDGDRDRDHDGDRDRDGGRGYGNGGYGNMSVARQNGFRDGMNDGSHDRATGHSFRPTHDDNYKNAPGYTSSMGDRQQYKNEYRSAYQQAYQQGYNGRR